MTDGAALSCAALLPPPSAAAEAPLLRNRTNVHASCIFMTLKLWLSFNMALKLVMESAPMKYG